MSSSPWLFIELLSTFHRLITHMAFLTLGVLVSLYSRVLVNHPNLIFSFPRLFIPLNVGSRDLVPCGFAPSWFILCFYFLSLVCLLPISHPCRKIQSLFAFLSISIVSFSRFLFVFFHLFIFLTTIFSFLELEIFSFDLKKKEKKKNENGKERKKEKIILQKKNRAEEKENKTKKGLSNHKCISSLNLCCSFPSSLFATSRFTSKYLLQVLI